MNNETLATIARRYACRDFTEKMPGVGELQAIAKAALAAPSGVNRQLWRVIIVRDKKLIGELEEEGMRVLSELPDKSAYERILSRGGKLFYNAPCMAVIPTGKASPEGAEYFDCGIIAQNIALAATSLGIDNVICGLSCVSFAGSRKDEFKARLGFPEGYDIGISVLLGYASKPGKPHELDQEKVSFIG
ncbi:MAG: nitroreductase family protein [Clostridiales bacterium]|jgi:nitroreductase|nr:nitroreductase family protein [Clostridiales bacterium]